MSGIPGATSVSGWLRVKLFYRLAQQAVTFDPVPYDQIVHPTSTGNSKSQTTNL
jgi:hypothetical protein